MPLGITLSPLTAHPMDLKVGIGKTGLAMAILIAFAMCLLNLLFNPVSIPHIQYGFCLPSPDSWGFDPFWSWCINTLLIGIIALLLFLVNKTYNFLRTTEPAYIAIFLIMAASGPWFTSELNTSVLLCLANVVCLGIMFDTYASHNATQEVFIIGLVAGLGSMVQYAFLPMAVVYAIWILFMKVMRIKEAFAYAAGLFCPYWIALGTGWVRLSDFHFPSIIPLFSFSQDPSEFFILLSCIAVAAVVGCLVTFLNFLKLYAGNSRVNAMNLCVSFLGAFSLICILIDFDNMPAYVITLYMTCAIQLGNLCALWNPSRPWMVTLWPSLLYIAAFVCSLVL